MQKLEETELRKTDRTVDTVGVNWCIFNNYSMAIIISYPTSASGIIVLLNTPQNRGKLD